VHKISLTLEELYRGKTVRMNVTRKAPGPNFASAECHTCDGRGVIMQTIQLGPAMIQQSCGTCPSCSGTGHVVKGLVSETKLLTVNVRPGAVDGDTMVVSGEGDYDCTESCHTDVVLMIKQHKHAVFERKDAKHLFMKRTITLYDYLGGTDVVFAHLDGKQHRVSVNPGDAAKCRVFCVEGLGMPTSSGQYGNLYMEFAVEFTSNSVHSELTQLVQRLGLNKTIPASDSITEETLQHVSSQCTQQ
jgi:DnaJ-class molecular chaperone